MSADTLTKDESIHLMQAEIERLRSLVKEEQRDDLTTAALYGFHQRDDEVAGLKAEIARLRDAAVIARTTHANLHEEIERLRQETLVQSEAIETLRGLLREIGDIGWLQAPHPLTKRVREALGE